MTAVCSEVLLCIVEDGRKLFEPFLESIELFTFAEIDSFFLVSRVEYYSWVCLDVNSCRIISGVIQLANHKIFVVFVNLAELIPDWKKLFAVFTPWSIIQDKHILGCVLDNLLMIESNNDSHGPIVALWNRL